uniref:Transporter n=1 Tax=Angiostrongylus cantonensis TaxID=6313 RepID=A0A0K0DCZ2_ANGCA
MTNIGGGAVALFIGLPGKIEKPKTNQWNYSPLSFYPFHGVFGIDSDVREISTVPRYIVVTGFEWLSVELRCDPPSQRLH